MTRAFKNHQVICYGEMLWDVLPSGRQPGGGPMNVTVHLKNFGLSPKIISRIGSDDLGKELMDFLEEKSVDTSLVQLGQTHLTGVVKANVSDSEEVVYKIVQPVAWDYIQWEEALEEEVKKADMFVYGSLITRQDPSRSTLYKLLESAHYKVFDVNLRPPHYTPERVAKLLQHADLLKMNTEELREITTWFRPAEDDLDCMKFLQDRFEIESICVSRGGKGAWLLENGQLIQQSGFAVEVKDTIGSGDSFLAMFLKNKLEGKDGQTALQYACAVGAIVATYEGAVPNVSWEEIKQIMQP